MSLEARLEKEKEAVARLLAGIFGPTSDSTKKVAAKLERELADQIRFDHRELEPTDLLAAWSSFPTIGQTAATSPAMVPAVEEIPGLVHSTYAFRMLTLAHILSEFQATGNGDRVSFDALLPALGLGLREVEAYKVDFVK